MRGRPSFGHDGLMLSHRCAFCGNQTHFTARYGTFQKEVGSTGDGYPVMTIEVAATCDACQRFNVATGRVAYRSVNVPRPGKKIEQGLDVYAEGMSDVHWSPPSMVQADTEFLPDNVGIFLQEAHDTAAVGAYRGTLLLVRSVIEATAKDRGIAEGSLVQKVNNLHANGHIRTGTKDMAHALRILGNDMAHGDITEAPTEEDANDALTIARFVLDDVYVADARRIDMLKRRSKDA